MERREDRADDIAAPQRGGSWLECDNEAAQGDDKAERRVQASVKTRECRVASDLEEADRAEVTNSAKCEDRTKCPHAELEEPGSCPLPGQDVRSQGHDHCCCGQKYRDDERGRAAWAKRRYAIDFRDRGLRPPATAERPVDMKGGEQEEQQNERACHDCGHGNHSASEPLSSRAAVANAVFTSIGRATIALAVNISPALHAPQDGSWFVKSRAMKIQPYFESGFPYGKNQFISVAASGWAAAALALALPAGP